MPCCPYNSAVTDAAFHSAQDSQRSGEGGVLLLRFCSWFVFCFCVFVVDCEVGPMENCDVGAHMGGGFEGENCNVFAVARDDV